MIGKVYSAPAEIFESGLFIVLGRDSSPEYHPSRRPWFLQVQHYVDGKGTGAWVPITLAEFKKWNPNVAITPLERIVCAKCKRTSEPSESEDSVC